MIDNGKNICFATAPNSQTALLTQAVEKETGYNCFHCASTSVDEFNSCSQDSLNLVLIDFKNPFCPHFKSDLPCCGSKPCPLPESVIFAFFNFQPESEISKSDLSNGLKGVFFENESSGNICKGIRALFNGEFWFPRKILTQWIATHSPASPSGTENRKIDITPREREILLQISMGSNNKEIAKILYISPLTVKTHTTNIYKKIGVSSRLQAALWVAKNL